MYDPMDIREQKKIQDDKELKSKLARETEESDLKWLLGSKRGRRIVWRLLEQSGVFRSSFNPIAMQMAFNEGYRNYGNTILALIHEHYPEYYPLMMKESSNDRANNIGHGNNSK